MAEDDDLKIEIIEENQTGHTFSTLNRDTTWKEFNNIADETEKRGALSDWRFEGHIINSNNPAIWNVALESFQEAWLNEVENGSADVQPPYKVEFVFNFLGEGLNTGKAKLYGTALYVIPLYDSVTLGNLSDFANKVEALTMEKAKDIPHSARF